MILWFWPNSSKWSLNNWTKLAPQTRVYNFEFYSGPDFVSNGRTYKGIKEKYSGFNISNTFDTMAGMDNMTGSNTTPINWANHVKTKIFTITNSRFSQLGLSMDMQLGTVKIVNDQKTSNDDGTNTVRVFSSISGAGGLGGLSSSNIRVDLANIASGGSAQEIYHNFGILHEDNIQAFATGNAICNRVLSRQSSDHIETHDDSVANLAALYQASTGVGCILSGKFANNFGSAPANRDFVALLSNSFFNKVWFQGTVDANGEFRIYVPQQYMNTHGSKKHKLFLGEHNGGSNTFDYKVIENITLQSGVNQNFGNWISLPLQSSLIAGCGARVIPNYTSFSMD